MDEIQTRLQDTSQDCLKAYADWMGSKKDVKAQEALHTAIHELRKVSSRLEIELALSERDQMTSKPLPIPSHKAMNKNSSTPILEGAQDPENDSAASHQTKTVSKRRRSSRKQGGGNAE